MTKLMLSTRINELMFHILFHPLNIKFSLLAISIIRKLQVNRGNAAG